jgi:DNA-directed RNA polymerase specialized sigma24 family protein
MIETDLIKHCQQRDEDSFEQLYKTYATKAFRTACLLVSRRDLAEDILQDPFFECYRDINRLHKPI